uniref:Carboxylic ester hydrolase n=1 Tax=Leptinotarsa decemlineata TaxID=7539 RepID=A0A0A7ENR1_LEPDE|nr:esterase [Leptinotarsa decemlineata]
MNLWMTFLLLNYVTFIFAEDDIIVQLWKKKGKIRGHVLKSGKGKDYYAFHEIPYAVPPIGHNRFKEPIEAEDWNGILNTTVNKKVCMQNNEIAYTKIPDSMEMSEDCLFLNVYTPVRPNNTGNVLLPVLFWIHAGGYFYGSGAYQYWDPKFFIDAGIIVVTMNYRFGPFGFLTTADDVIPANLGLKDTVLAYEWVLRNIHLFGGDIKRITIAGESAGGFSVGFLQLSRKLRGKASAFIMESGSPLSPVAIQEDPRYLAFSMGKALDPTFNSTNSKDLLNVLQQASALDILMANVRNERYPMDLDARNIIWVPAIENADNPNAVVTSPMHEALMSGDFTQAPLLTGFCTEEYRFFIRNLNIEQIQTKGESFDRNASYIMHPNLHVSKSDLKTAASKYRSIYTNGTFESNPGAFVKYLSGDIFIISGIRHAELASKFSPVFLYQFSYLGEMDGLSFLPNVTGSDPVAHTAELKYLFGGVEGFAGEPEDYSQSDQLTMKRMLALWTNFIKYQNPTPNSNQLLNNIIWPRLRAGDMQYLNINSTLEVRYNPKSYKEVKEVLTEYMQPPLTVF